jgi:glycosyltransferase involved in cell wall biosynthesis
MDNIDISIIIPTFHRETQLVEAMTSVLSQRDVALELIVVDDSAEGSARDAAASLSDPRVRYFARSEPSNGRPARARNDGAACAQGRYLYFLDDDDILEQGTLATLSAALDAAPGAGLAFGVVTPFGANEGLLRHNQAYFADARRIALKLRGPRQLSAYLTFKSTILVCSACMVRRAAFVAVGGFDAGIPVCEDTELMARIDQSSGHVFVDHPVVRYRTGAPSLMNALAEGDEKLQVSYQRIQEKYRQANGLMQFVAMKIWARIMLR